MSDIVGGASYKIEPDVADFSADLAAALGPALAAAQDAVVAAAANMSSGLNTVSDAAEETGSNLSGSFDAAASGAAAAVGMATDSVVADLGEVDAAASMLGAGISDAIAPAVDSAAADVSLATEGMVDDLASVSDAGAGVAEGVVGIGDAVTETVAPAFSDMSDSALSMLSNIEIEAASAGRAIEYEIGGSVLTTRDLIEGVALGNLISTGVTAGLGLIQDKLVEFVSYLPELGAEVQGTFNDMRVNTGLVGDELEGMKQSFSDVFTQSTADADQISFALQQVRSGLGLTGDDAETLTLSLLRFAKVTKSDVNNTVDTATELFRLYGVATDDQVGQLDKLLRVSQATAIPMQELLGQVSNFAPKFKAAGFSIDEVSALVGKLNQSGVAVGPVMMGLNSYVAKLAQAGMDGKAGLQAVFDQIAAAPNKIAAADIAVAAFGQRAGPLLADQIQGGNFAIADLVAQVQAGGDTVNQAAADTAGWSGALELLRHQIADKLTPIAVWSFNMITTIIRGIRPALTQVIDLVAGWLNPAFEALKALVAPVADFFAHLTDALGHFVEQISQGVEPWFILVSFLDRVSGFDTKWAVELTARVIEIYRAFDAWRASTEPLRATISETFGEIVGWIQDFTAANPVVVISALGAALLTILFPALVAVGGAFITAGTAIAGFLASAALAAASFLAIPLAIAAVVGGLVWLYQNVEPVHELFDSIGRTLRDGFLVVLAAVVSFIRDTFIPIVMELWGVVQQVFVESIKPALDDLWKTIQTDGLPILQFLAEHWQVIAGVIAAVVSPVTLVAGALFLLWTNVEPLRDAVAALLPIFVEWTAGLIQLGGGVLGNVISLISGLITVISGLVQGDWSKVGEGLAKMAQAILDFFGTALAKLPTLVVDTMQAVINVVLDALSNIPVLGNLFDGLKTILGGVFDAARGIFEIIEGLLTLDFGKVVSGLGGIVSSAKDILAGLLGGVGGFLADLGRMIWDGLVALGPLIMQGLGLAWEGLEALAPIVLAALGTLLSNIPGWLLTALSALGSVILAGLSAAWDWVTDNWQSILAGLLVAVTTVPSLILAALGNFGPTLVGWFTTAVGWFLQAPGVIFQALFDWVASIPQQLLDILSASISFFGTALILAIEWVVSNGPSILSGLLSFFMGVPMLIVGAIGNLGLWLHDNVFVPAITWLVENGPSMIAGILSFFADLPNKITESIGNLGQWLHDNVFIPMAIWLIEHWPEIRESVLDFFRELPGNIVEALGNLGQTIWDWLVGAFDWIVEQAPGLVTGLLDWFKGLPGLIFDAIKSGLESAGGFIGDLGKSLFNAISGFLNDHLLLPIRNFKVTLVGQEFTPFEGIPLLPVMAKYGGIFNHATSVILGEAGQEAVVPLTRPREAARVAAQAGLPQILASQGMGGGGGDTINLQVIVQATPETTEEHAMMVGDAAGEAAARKLRLRTAVRSS